MDTNNYIELALLRADLTDKEVDELVRKAIDGKFYSICVPPFWTKRAFREINGRDLILSTTVGTPFGYQMTETKLLEIEKAIVNGSHEVDVMMNASAYISGMSWTKIEFAKCSKLAHEHSIIVKVIMDASLFDLESGKEISKIAGDAGVDFLHITFPSQSLEWSVDYLSKIKTLLPSTIGLHASSPVFGQDDVLKIIEQGVDRVSIAF